jgi:hypothetical protein
MRAILRRESLWDIIENVVTPSAFPAVINGIQVTEFML